MYLSIDPGRLRDHIIYLRQELALSQQLLEQLEKQRQLQIELYGSVPEIYNQHVQFAKELQERIRERRILLEYVTELLWDAEGKLSETLSTNLEMLDERMIGAGID